jgi:hypothetical protein
MCIRCKHADAPEPLGYCAVCALQARIEIGAGMKRLAAYLAAWAAFEDWLAAQRRV